MAAESGVAWRRRGRDVGTMVTMSSEWVGVIGGLVGGVIGVSGSVVVQLLGNKQGLAIAREQWAEERKVKYRDERKIAYEKFSTLYRDLATAVLGASMLGETRTTVTRGDHNAPIRAAVSALRPSLDELQLVGSDAVRPLSEQLAHRLSGLMLNITAAEVGLWGGGEHTYKSWAEHIMTDGDALMRAAVLDVN